MKVTPTHAVIAGAVAVVAIYALGRRAAKPLGQAAAGYNAVNDAIEDAGGAAPPDAKMLGVVDTFKVGWAVVVAKVKSITADHS